MKPRHRGPTRREPIARPSEDLEVCLREIDGRSYGDYRCLEGGSFSLGACRLQFDRVQADPFAPPSRLCLEVPAHWLELPPDLRETSDQRRAAADFLHRALLTGLRRDSGGGPSRTSGSLGMASPGQEVLSRSAVRVRPDGSCQIRFTAGLPAAGRRIRGHAAAILLLEKFPRVLQESISPDVLDHAALRQHLAVVEDQVFLRAALAERGLVAFVADGAILPRASGVDDRPMTDGLPLFAPDALAVELELPHGGLVRGMGIPEGVTLIVGGSYHGKSTLLQTLARGVWDQIPGDGRERCVSLSEAVCVRAENGRSVASVDLRPFMQNLPLGRSSRCFSSADASGATSQAASIVESLEAGARVLLIDEDTAATNFMIRDARMRRLIPDGEEPITPYLDRVRQLADDKNISSVLVVGGAGDYLEVADTVIRMESYRALEVTEDARRIARELPGAATQSSGRPGDWPIAHPRIPQPESFAATGRGRSRPVRRGDGYRLSFGDQSLDLAFSEQLVEPGQVSLIGDLLQDHGRGICDGETALADLLAHAAEKLARGSVVDLAAPGCGDRVAIRSLDLAYAINRLRALSCVESEKT